MKTVITYTDVSNGKPLHLVEPEFIYFVKEYPIEPSSKPEGQIKKTISKYTAQLVSTHQIKIRKDINIQGLKTIPAHLYNAMCPERDIIVAIWKPEIYLGTEDEKY